MRILVTGSAGFIGAHVCAKLQNLAGYEIYGVDNFNDYYDVELKRARAAYLTPKLDHQHVDIADERATALLIERMKPDIVVHLAAQAGVRHSFNQPMSYSRSNLTGQISILEGIRSVKSVKRFIYASSSSVYSGVSTLPFKEDVRLGTPKSLYAATKIGGEVLTDTYSGLFAIDAVGLRFFTVYGPWGRPDMAYWSFAESILDRRDITLFNFGDVKRDFTFIDDVVQTVVSMVSEVQAEENSFARHRIYNVGNHSPEPVRKMVSILEQNLGIRASIQLAPLPPGDMIETYANVDRLQADYGFSPRTSLSEGLSKFVDWFQDWRHGEKYSL